VTYNSPRTSRDSNLNEFYALLQNSEMLETDKITAELLLTQDDTELRVGKESASLHIREDTDGLKVYVPGDKRSQEVCFYTKLPRCLCEWIMTDPATQIVAPVSPDAVAIVQSVLSAQPFAINDILNEHGIVEVNIADEKEVYREETTTVAQVWFLTAAPIEASNNNSPWPETPTSRNHSSTEVSSDDSPGLATPLPSSVASPGVIPSVDVAARSNHEASRPQLRPMDANGVVEGDPHLSLFRSVVDAPRRTTFPSRGAFDMSAVNAALPRGSGDNDATTESLATKVDQPDRA
jgi:hypothetical protein